QHHDVESGGQTAEPDECAEDHSKRDAIITRPGAKQAGIAGLFYFPSAFPIACWFIAQASVLHFN
ncbi:hypothetical protein ACV35V_35070, partial [Pseudomonas aeruginosa]